MNETGLAALPEDYFWRIAEHGNYYPYYAMELRRKKGRRNRSTLWGSSRIFSATEFREEQVRAVNQEATLYSVAATGRRLDTYEDYLNDASEVLKAEWIADTYGSHTDASYKGDYPPKSLVR